MQAERLESAEPFVIHGDYVVDATTGEIVGLSRDIPRDEPWRIESTDDRDWVLSLRFEREQNIAALKRRITNLQAMIRDEERAISWWNKRFLTDLQRFTAQQLDGQKARSIKSEYGTCGFRRRPGGIGVWDRSKALEWAKQHAPEAVATDERLVVGPLKGREAELPAELFNVEQPHDAFYVDVKVGD